MVRISLRKLPLTVCAPNLLFSPLSCGEQSASRGNFLRPFLTVCGGFNAEFDDHARTVRKWTPEEYLSICLQSEETPYVVAPEPACSSSQKTTPQKRPLITELTNVGGNPNALVKGNDFYKSNVKTVNLFLFMYMWF